MTLSSTATHCDGSPVPTNCFPWLVEFSPIITSNRGLLWGGTCTIPFDLEYGDRHASTGLPMAEPYTQSHKPWKHNYMHAYTNTCTHKYTRSKRDMQEYTATHVHAMLTQVRVQRHTLRHTYMYTQIGVRDFWAPAVWAPAVSIECWWKRDEWKNDDLTEMEAGFIFG